tara:strand:+ start:275 stop:490 length:216 start_codon:yes stop_codon:yes gene_type:complete
MKLTEQRKKQLEQYDDSHIFYFRNIYTEHEINYICKIKPQFKIVFTNPEKIKHNSKELEEICRDYPLDLWK